MYLNYVLNAHFSLFDKFIISTKYSEKVMIINKYCWLCESIQRNVTSKKPVIFLSFRGYMLQYARALAIMVAWGVTAN